MLKVFRGAAYASLLWLAFACMPAVAQDHSFTEGPVVRMTAIRTEYGKFDEFMKFLDTAWKPAQEAAKKAGYVLSYEVFRAEPRTEDDPDIYAVVTYKNWAALDNATEKSDAMAKQIAGSVAAENQGASDRNKIRRVLGSSTMQVLNLK